MTKYEKAVAYINEVLCGLTQAELSGINKDMVYIYTGVEAHQFLIDNVEVDLLAHKYDTHQNQH